MFSDLANIFESFLPQLLTYPNPTDPLNGEAASLYLHKPDDFKTKCAEYVRKYASEDALGTMVRTQNSTDEYDEGNESDSTISEFYEGQRILIGEHRLIKLILDETLGMEL